MSIKKTFWQAMVPENPVFILGLGLCSTLAVTSDLLNAVFMSVMVAFTAVSSSVLISMMREFIPFRFRFITYMMVVSSLVITVQQFLHALYPEIASALGPYVGLIVTNCIVMGRLESFSARNSVKTSFFDAFGMSCGYGMFLIFMGGFRELFGNGNLLGLRVMPDWYPACRFLVTAPGAFLVFALLIFSGNYIAWQQKRGN